MLTHNKRNVDRVELFFKSLDGNFKFKLISFVLVFMFFSILFGYFAMALDYESNYCYSAEELPKQTKTYYIDYSGDEDWFYIEFPDDYSTYDDVDLNIYGYGSSSVTYEIYERCSDSYPYAWTWMNHDGAQVIVPLDEIDSYIDRVYLHVFGSSGESYSFFYYFSDDAEDYCYSYRDSLVIDSSENYDSLRGYVHYENDNDWYVVRVRGHRGDKVTFKLEVPNNVDYDLEVYSTCSDSSPFCVSRKSGSQEEECVDDYIDDNDESYYVRIYPYHFSEEYSSRPYKLKVYVQKSTSCGDHKCDSGEDCASDCLIIKDVYPLADNINEGHSARIGVRVKNIGDVKQSLYLEAGIMPESWEDEAYPSSEGYDVAHQGLSPSSSVAIDVDSCCEDNEFVQAKKISIDPHDTETIVFNVIAPSRISYDHCNDLGSAWDNDFYIIAGLYGECGKGYTYFKKRSVDVEEVDDDASDSCYLYPTLLDLFTSTVWYKINYYKDEDWFEIPLTGIVKKDMFFKIKVYGGNDLKTNVYESCYSDPVKEIRDNNYHLIPIDGWDGDYIYLRVKPKYSSDYDLYYAFQLSATDAFGESCRLSEESSFSSDSKGFMSEYIQHSYDEDWYEFRFNNLVGHKVRFKLEVPTRVDYDMLVYRSCSGSSLNSYTTGDGVDEYYTYTIRSNSDRVYIKVFSHINDYGENSYRLRYEIYEPSDSESNSCSSAKGIHTIPGSYSGKVDYNSDKDWYKLDYSSMTNLGAYVIKFYGDSSTKYYFYDSCSGRRIDYGSGASEGTTIYIPVSQAPLKNVYLLVTGRNIKDYSFSLDYDDYPNNCHNAYDASALSTISGTFYDSSDLDWLRYDFNAYGENKVYKFKIVEGSARISIYDDNCNKIKDCSGGLCEIDSSHGKKFRILLQMQTTRNYKLNVYVSDKDDFPNSCSQANARPISSSINGRLSSSSDVDWIKLDSASYVGKRLKISIHGMNFALYPSCVGNEICNTSDACVIDLDRQYYYLEVFGSNSGDYRIDFDIYDDDYSNLCSMPEHYNFPSTINGKIDYAYDLDWFDFDLSSRPDDVAVIFKLLGHGSLRVYGDNCSNLSICSRNECVLDSDYTKDHVLVKVVSPTPGEYTLEGYYDDFPNSCNSAVYLHESYIRGRIDYPNDKDWFRIDKKDSDYMVISVEGNSGNGFVVYNGCNGGVICNVMQGNNCSFPTTDFGDIYLKVVGTNIDNYTIRITKKKYYCGDHICDPHESCASDCLIIDSIHPSKDRVGEGHVLRVDISVRNLGTVKQSLYLESGIMPSSWEGRAYPSDDGYGSVSSKGLPLDTSTSVDVDSCCPDNEFVQAKKVTLNPNEMINVRFYLRAPTQSSYDHCNDLGSAWDNDFYIIAGLYDECGRGYTYFKKHQINVESCVIPDGSSEFCSCNDDSDCPHYYVCDYAAGKPYRACIPKKDECSNPGHYYCHDNNVYYCRYNGVYNQAVLVDICTSDEFCDNSKVDSLRECSDLEKTYWLEFYYTKPNNINAMVNDVIPITIHSTITQTLAIDAESNIDSLCGPSVLVKPSNPVTCEFIVKSPFPQDSWIKIGKKVVHLNVLVAPNIVVITNLDLLEKEGRLYSRTVNELMRYAYSNNGVFYDLASQGLVAPYKNAVEFRSLSVDEINQYEQEISNFVIQHCVPFADLSHDRDLETGLAEALPHCSAVVIAGDDFVVPYYRNNVSKYSSLIKDWFERKESELIPTDQPMYAQVYLTFKNFRALFTDKPLLYINKDDLKYKGKKTIFVIPDGKYNEFKPYLDELESALSKFDARVEVRNASDVFCVYSGLWNNPLRGATVFVFGNLSNNRAFNCFPFLRDDVVDGLLTIQPSPWDREQFTVLLGMDSVDRIHDLVVLINTTTIENLKGHSAYLLKVATTYADTAFMIVGLSLMVASTGGVALPAAIAAMAEGAGVIGLTYHIIETGGDFVDFANDCFVNKQNNFFCGVSAAAVILPISSSSMKFLAKALDINLDDFFKIMKKADSFDDLTKSRIATKVMGKYSDEILGVLRNDQLAEGLSKNEHLLSKLFSWNHIYSKTVVDQLSELAKVKKISQIDDFAKLSKKQYKALAKRLGMSLEDTKEIIDSVIRRYVITDSVYGFAKNGKRGLFKIMKSSNDPEIAKKFYYYLQAKLVNGLGALSETFQDVDDFRRVLAKFGDSNPLIVQDFIVKVGILSDLNNELGHELDDIFKLLKDIDYSNLDDYSLYVLSKSLGDLFSSKTNINFIYKNGVIGLDVSKLSSRGLRGKISEILGTINEVRKGNLLLGTDINIGYKSLGESLKNELDDILRKFVPDYSSVGKNQITDLDIISFSPKTKKIVFKEVKTSVDTLNAAELYKQRITQAIVMEFLEKHADELPETDEFLKKLSKGLSKYGVEDRLEIVFAKNPVKDISDRHEAMRKLREIMYKIVQGINDQLKANVYPHLTDKEDIEMLKHYLEKIGTVKKDGSRYYLQSLFYEIIEK